MLEQKHRYQNSTASYIHFVPPIWLKGRTSETGTSTYFKLDASFRGFMWQLEQVLERVSCRSRQTEQRSCNNCPKIYTCDLISLINLHSKTGQDAPGWWQRCAQTSPQHSNAIESKIHLGFSAIIHTNWVFPTHHSLMVDLNHLISCMDLLALVRWRLQWRAVIGYV